MVNGNSTVERASDQFQPGTAPQVQHGLIKNTAYYINVLSEICKDLSRIFRGVLKGDNLKFDVRVQRLDSGPEFHQELCRSHGRGTDTDDVLILLHGVFGPCHGVPAISNDIFGVLIHGASGFCQCQPTVTAVE